jgi:membrane protein
MVSDAGRLIGLGLVLAVSLGLTVLGGFLAGAVAGPEGAGVVRAVLATATTLALSLVANLLIVLWMLARLPREPVALRTAAAPALLAAVGFEVIQQVGTVYLGWVTGSPAGIVFGPILGLLVAVYLGARLLLFATAWAATRGHVPLEEPPPEDPPVGPPPLSLGG